MSDAILFLFTVFHVIKPLGDGFLSEQFFTFEVWHLFIYYILATNCIFIIKNELERETTNLFLTFNTLLLYM